MGKAKDSQKDAAGPENGRPLSRAWWIALLVPVVGVVAAAVAPDIYRDLRAGVLPGEVFGSYILLAPDDEDSRQLHVSGLNMKSHGYELWAREVSGRKSWVYAGYINMGYVVLSYRSEDPLGIGFGQYFLAPRDGERAEFTGHMTGNFCGHADAQPRRRIVQCNVVMVRGEPGGVAELSARKTYADYLARPCVLEGEATAVPAEICAAAAR